MLTRLLARWVLAFDPALDDHVLLTDAEVVVEDDRIHAVGAPSELAVDVTIDLGASLLMPGLIDLDALADIDHALLDSWGSAARRARLAWSWDYASGDRRHVFDAAERRTVRRYALAQLVMNGVTTAMPIAAETHSEWAESFDDAVAMAEEAERLGLRIFAGPSYRSGVSTWHQDGPRIYWDEARGLDGLDGAIRFVEWARDHASPLVEGVLLPCRIETMSDDLLALTASAATDLDVVVRLHALQGLAERDAMVARGHRSPVDLLSDSGLLGDRLLVPHCIYVDDNPSVVEHDRARGRGRPGGGGVARLGEAGVTTIHCPLTSARYGTALPGFAHFRDHGVRIALGSDSFPPDLVRGIETGINVAKVLTGQLDTVEVDDYIRAATLGGADALRRPDLGRVAPGCQADLVAFALDDPRDGAVDDPVRTLIMNGTARTARLSMVAGSVVMKDGRPTSLDVEALHGEAQRLFEKMKAGYAARGLPSTVDALFPPTFTASSREAGTVIQRR